MNNPDQDTIIRAVEDARRILGEYRGDAKRTVERLLIVLDSSDVVHALDRYGWWNDRKRCSALTFQIVP